MLRVIKYLINCIFKDIPQLHTNPILNEKIKY